MIFVAIIPKILNATRCFCVDTIAFISKSHSGSTPRPGEISLAHHGVLFLDELPEFERRVLEWLREPLESGHIHISRAARHAEFPASFQLVAAMNPCPCGFHGDPSGRCKCTPDQVLRYRCPSSKLGKYFIRDTVKLRRSGFRCTTQKLRPENTGP